MSEKDKTSTFEDTKKYILDKIWNKLPKWLRITFASLVIVITPIIATKSIWYPTVSKIIFPPVSRIIFRGYIYSNNEKEPFKTRIQLIDNKNNQITDKESDDDGLVVFNIPDNKPVKSIKCLYSNKWQSYDVNDDLMKTSKKFTIILSNNSIEWK